MARRAGVLAVALLAAAAAADVPVEEPGRVETLGPPTPHWLIVSDLMLNRTALVDLDTGTFLGLISTGYNSLTAVAPRRGVNLYVPETFYSRGSRGDRSDVVTVYDTKLLAPVAEIAIPAKRAVNVLPTANATITDDDRFVLVFNMNPATSVSVVDTQEQIFTAEVAVPGCGLVFAAGTRRFFSVCADGSLLMVTIDDGGHPVDTRRSDPFFDPEKDPLTEKAVRAGDEWLFVSFEGIVHPVDVAGDDIRFGETWPLFTDAERKESWRIGGTQHLAVHPGTGKLFSLVHQGGPDTQHDPGDELWVYDIDRRERVQKIELVHPGFDFLGESPAFGEDWVWPFDGLYDFVLSLLPADISNVLVTRDDKPLLVTGSEIGGSVAVFDASSGEFLRRVASGNLTVQRLDAPWDGGGSR